MSEFAFRPVPSSASGVDKRGGPWACRTLMSGSSGPSAPDSSGRLLRGWRRRSAPDHHERRPDIRPEPWPRSEEALPRDAHDCEVVPSPTMYAHDLLRAGKRRSRTHSSRREPMRSGVWSSCASRLCRAAGPPRGRRVVSGHELAAHSVRDATVMRFTPEDTCRRCDCVPEESFDARRCS